MDERDRPDMAQASSLRETGWKARPHTPPDGHGAGFDTKGQVASAISNEMLTRF